ncbi:MAG: agmatinase [Nanoarchaeota archaeon]|nr:agmatinase [Nanoarchaeota archaeon]
MVNYGGLPKEYSSFGSAAIAVLPIPYDGTSTWGKGADNGPAALIEASANMELYDIETHSEVYKRGIVTVEPVKEKKSPEAMVAAGKKRVSELLNAGKFVVTLGGEHSISAGPIYAHVEKYPRMSVLQIDAHSDLRSEYHGSKHNHACIMARVQEKCPIAQVGIRSMDSSERQNMDTKRVVFAHQLQEPGWQERVLKLLTPEVYVTIDLDAFDSSIMPSTGTPEPGGMDWYQVTGLLKKVAASKRIVGFDVVELAPNPQDKAPDFLASKLIYTLLSMIFEGEQK